MSITVPVTFADGNYLYASQLNSCFAALAVAYNAGGDTLTGNMDVNLFQLVEAKLEVLAVDPAVGNAGRVWYNSADVAVKFEDGLAVYTLSNTAHTHSGLTDVLSADPGAPTEGDVWFNTTSHLLKFKDNSTTQTVATAADLTAVAWEARNDWRLIKSGGNLTLSPIGGNKININGTMYTDATPPTIAATGLSASTLYYVYTYINSGALTLELSATGYTIAASGRPEKTGDASRRLVGLAYTDAAGAVQDTATQRFVLSYDHRRNRPMLDSFAATPALGTSSSWVAVNSSEVMLEFICWGDEAAAFSYATTIVQPGTAQLYGVGLGLDGVGSVHGDQYTSGAAGYRQPVSASIVVENTVGYHYYTIATKNDTGSDGAGTIQGRAFGMIRG